MSQRVADELENRRGLVLGLTLAELLLLLLFLLLLALSWRMTSLREEAASEKARATALELELGQIRVTLDTLSPLLVELQREGRLNVNSLQELVVKISRVDSLDREISALKSENGNLTSELRALKAITQDRDKLQMFREAIAAGFEINPDDPPAALVRAVEVLKRIGVDTQPEQIPAGGQYSELQNKLTVAQGERDKFERQVKNLQRSGNGLTYPSCWSTPEGQTEYMFDVTISDGGLTVRDATPGRANDAQMKMVQPFGRGTMVSETTFQQATAQVFAWSKQQNCRFYAIIRDNTGDSKKRYKQLRASVESHFYPLHLPMVASRQPRSPLVPTDTPSGVGGPFIPALSGSRTH